VNFKPVTLIDDDEDTKCATPKITNNNGMLTFSCETEGATCHYKITRTGTGNSVAMPEEAVHEVTVWATKAGYQDSDIVTTTINLKKGDVDGNGKVTITDAVKVVNIILGN
jgi:hypothetical protein